ncbi:Protein-lysine N-methyltransferase efm5 [Microbotryomycetes sp. JL221]|nr:Protein-lysine N-methyltransferase efm5 [Microbotryomycetes sp. JL221]
MSGNVNIPLSSAEREQDAASDVSGSPPLQLDPSTLAILNSFLTEKTEAEEKFRKLEEQAHARLVKQQDADAQATMNDSSAADDDQGGAQEPMMSVEEFRTMFGEDWQLSQFWYSNEFATRLAKWIKSFCSSESDRIAFLCCPTGYVGFQHTNPIKGTKLLEYDRRFGLFGGKDYVPYDIDEPENIPDDLKGAIDIAVADPPYLNEVTNQKLAKTLKLLLKPRGRLILLTSTSVEHLFDSIYTDEPVGPLRKTDIQVTHAGGIANSFGVWANWDMPNGSGF